MDPLNGLRSMGKRMTGQVEPRAQDVAERVIDLVVRSLDVNALVQQIDPEPIIVQVDLDKLIDRLDLNKLIDRVDLDKLLARVDVDALLSQVDIDRLLARVDVATVVDRVDVNEVAQRLDIDALAAQTDLGSVIARSSGGIAANALDVLRSQAVGLDEFIARWVGRLRRKPYSGPPGPPERLRATGAAVRTGPAAVPGPAVSGPAIGTAQP